MAKKSEPPKLVTWDVYRAASKPKIVGSVQAADADEAVQKAAQEFKVDAWRLIAMQRR
jgi:1,2-phenylacetyl-CoA epoxidase PaaB subunit